MGIWPRSTAGGLSDRDMTYQDINNIADLIWQAVDILGRDSFKKNVSIPDITIKPDLHEFNMMSFDTESVSTIIQRGYDAAVAHKEEIEDLKRRLGRTRRSSRVPPPWTWARYLLCCQP